MVQQVYDKISQLPDPAHGVDGTELMEMVQDGTNRKVRINQLLISGVGFVLVVDQHGLYPQSRYLVAGPGIVLTDGGAGSSLTISTSDAVVPVYVTQSPSAGMHNDYVLPGTGDYVIDMDTTAGDASFSGFVAQRDGQRLYLSNVGANLLNLLANNTGSLAANRIRVPSDLTAVQNNTITLQYSQGAARWLAV